MEIAAERAFGRLTGELSALGYPAAFVETCARIALDEGRHAGLCAGLARRFGATEPVAIPELVSGRDSLAPTSMPRAEAAIYDIVARCCVAETESTATLLRLLPGTSGEVHDVVHAIARDEVTHARLGWAVLASLAEAGRDLRFIADYLPAMLRTGGAPLFEPAALTDEDDDAADLGVLGRSTQRAIFVDALEQVIFPGFELHGVSTGPARAWLQSISRGVWVNP